MKTQTHILFTWICLAACILTLSLPDCCAQMGAGIHHSLFLCSQGQPMSCGLNTHGQLANTNSKYWENPAVQLDSLTDVIKVADGGYYTLYLKSDGTVWGSGDANQLGSNSYVRYYAPVQIGGLSGITDIYAAGGNSSFFLRNDSVWACGSNYGGIIGNGNGLPVWTPTLMPALAGTASIDGGYSHALYLMNDSTVWGCGSNDSGQLGNGTTTSRVTLGQILNLTGIIAVAAGEFHHSLFLKSDGTVWACGSNGWGELGDGTTIRRSTPVQVSGLTGIIAIAAGNECSYFLKSNGTVWACGNNDYGQLGDGTTTRRLTPVQVPGMTNVIDIAAASFHAHYLKNNGTVWASGNNAYGQLGNGVLTDSPVPVQMTGLTGIYEISTNRETLHFLKNDNTLWACGSNYYGELGTGDIPERTTVVTANTLSGIKALDAGDEHSLFLKSDGTAWSSGDNYYGQLGDGTLESKITPVQVNAISGIVAVAAGTYHSLFVKNDGTVWATGYNYYGQLGDGSYTDKSTATRVSNLTGIVAAAAGFTHSIFLKNDGTVWACGWNTSGQLGDGTGFTRLVPVQIPSLTGIVAIATGDSHTLFLKNDGTVWSCGSNYKGQLGIGTMVNSMVPVRVNSLTGIKKIDGGRNYSLFLRADGTAWGCGDNSYGQLGDGTRVNRLSPVQVTGLSGLSNVAAGYYHSLFLKSDSTAWACGNGPVGQLGNGMGYPAVFPTVLIPGQVLNLCRIDPGPALLPHMVSGRLFVDSSGDCLRQQSEQILPFIPVLAMPGNHYSYSNDTGYYALGLDDSISYTIQPIIPQHFSHMISNPCPANYATYLDTFSPYDTSGFDFGFDGSPCSQLRVDVSGNRKRRCARNLTTISYINEGLIAAVNAAVHVRFSSYDIPVSASLPFTVDPADGSLIFNLGTLNPWQGGTITIMDSIACIPGITDLTQCTKAWILPENLCLIDSTTGPNWDQSTLSVSGSCIVDTVQFVIYNTGSAMSTASQYRIFADNVLSQTSSFQLTSGDSLAIRLASGGATMRLEADQNPGHPGYSKPRSTVEACGTNTSGTYSTGQVNLAPQDDEDIHVEMDCIQIRDSYDPNEKVNSPQGIDAQHHIPPNTPIDFTIHFQNTGTDTAYKVVITDTLSNDFDLSTLETGTASHAYALSLSGSGFAVLKFEFENIFLVDSLTNVNKSSGFVKYKITPKSTTPLGTRINNNADIYFDFNFPVRTNTAFVTVGNLVLSVHPGLSENTGKISCYPNPTNGMLTLETSAENPIKKIQVFSMDGRNVYEEAFPGNAAAVQIKLNSLANGIYFLDCMTRQKVRKIRIVKY